jgi:hypothetical protein
MLASREWRDLSSSAKVLYICLKHKFVGGNNGEIELHYSELEDMMSSGTISAAFKQLVRMGWVEKTHLGGLYRYRNKYKLTGRHDETLVN